ncbi:Detected protein of confused Function [Hibiscus syriacus]|uniref:Detected protein of confused Function n=1 Tax=Hibiscus syriacus TaxID=106335 RepID=A0A6A2WY71_HIBSY|nr:Detected protein of confused Function [Hibiscus syriacus]
MDIFKLLRVLFFTNVYEDEKLVSHIRNVFFARQESSGGHIYSSVECSMKSSLFKQYFSPELLDSEVIPLDKAVQKEWPGGLLPEFAHRQKYGDTSFVLPMSSNHPKRATQVENKHEQLQLSSAAIDSNLEHQNQLGRHLIHNAVCKGETDGWKNTSLEPENVYANSPAVGSINLYNVALPAEQYGADHAYYSSNLLSSLLSDMVKPIGLSSYPNEFSAGCELYEVLGPAFLGKSIYADGQVVNTVAGTNIEMQEGMSCSQLTFESGSENLLEAVVANVCHSSSDMKREISFCRPALSSLTKGNTTEPSILTKSTINSAGYSINKSSLVEDNKQDCLNSSDLCGTMSSKAHSSTCFSNYEHHERSSEPDKNNKKRARPGENPRLRQGIDNSFKTCSIDSLLERTIKHMVFLQGITKHADKLGKCADSKMHQKGAGILGSSNYEQGSSWAVEVGSHLKVCSIVAENINKNGQIRVEPLSEECSHFLEIAEAIRSLGLTILKGFTEVHGEKTWICFVVEFNFASLFPKLILSSEHIAGTEESFSSNGNLMVSSANFAIQGYKLAARACHVREAVTLAPCVKYWLVCDFCLPIP